MEALQIIVPAFTLIVGLFIGYFLNQALYEKKRKDELADRDYNRRIQFKNQKLAEVQSYLDNNLLSAQKLLSYQGALILIDEPRSIQQYQTEFQKAHELTRLSASGTTNIVGLGDIELTNLNIKLSSLLLAGYDILSELMQKRLHNEPFEKEALLEKAGNSYKEIIILVSEMQTRLDNLSQM